MVTLEIIDSLLQNELQGLCTNCVKSEYCGYRKASKKIIIQCELFELTGNSDAGELVSNGMDGICINCDKANFCQLPSRHTGVWHCEEYA